MGNGLVYDIKKVRILDFPGIRQIACILNACGKDMVKKYDLHHWDNPYIKSLAIVFWGVYKNDAYLLYENARPIATFMTKIQDAVLHFEKLGTLPAESGRGIGSLCMKKIEELAKEAGCNKVVMEVYETSQHAISFYKHVGYEIVGETNTLKYKEVIMEKSII